MKEILARYYLLPLALLCAFYTYQAIDFPVHDFANYYFGGRFLAEGHFSPWIYFPYEFNKAIAAEGYTAVFANYAPNTPFLALFFLPLSFLSIATAKLVFNIASALLFLFTLVRLVRFYKIRREYVLLVPVLCFVPIKNELLFGQVYFLLFFLLGETWMAYKKNKKLKAALLLSLAILLKIFPILLVMAFVFRKKYTLLAYVGACCVALFSLSVISSGIGIWVFFVENVIPKASDGAISESYVPNYQSVFMFLKQMLVFEPTENPHAFFHYPALFAALIVAFKIKLIAIGYYISRKVKLPLVALSYWIVSMILLSPYGSTYTFILLLFPFLALALNNIARWKKIMGFALIGIISNVPVSWMASLHYPANFIRLFALLLLFALLVFLVYRSIRVLKVSVLAVIALVAVLLLRKESPALSGHVLGENAPILIYDYAFKGNELIYAFRDENGDHKATTAFDGSQAQQLELRENQIFYNGSQVTFDNGNKQKPLLIDGNMLVYLSDYDRGIGFYTLRKQPLTK